jgi:hypothetical protein
MENFIKHISAQKETLIVVVVVIIIVVVLLLHARFQIIRPIIKVTQMP